MGKCTPSLDLKDFIPLNMPIIFHNLPIPNKAHRLSTYPLIPTNTLGNIASNYTLNMMLSIINIVMKTIGYSLDNMEQNRLIKEK
jgi:hypothetical protein